MKTVFLGLMFLITAGGLAAKPLTFTFEEYQVDPTTYEVGEPYPVERLAGLTPPVRLSVELSAQGNGKASASMKGSTVSVDVRAVSVKDSRYQVTVKHESISAFSEGVPITSSRGTDTKIILKVGEPLVVGGIKGGADQQVEAHVMVVKLTD